MPVYSKSSPPKRDLYQEITDRIVEKLETGVAPWIRPWTNGAPPQGGAHRNAVSKREYSGINRTLLNMAPAFDCPYWLTFNQAKELGGRVRKGERATAIVFYKPWAVDRICKPCQGAGCEDCGHTGSRSKTLPVLRSYFVFNARQCDGLPDRFFQNGAPALPEPDRIARAEAFAKATGAVVRHGGDRAFFSTLTGHIQMPALAQFNGSGAPAYYATLLHELGHWTGAKNRLDRTFGRRFGDNAYAAEELVAEMTAAYLCAHLEIKGRLQHAEYIGSWLQTLKADNRAVFKAAAMAEKAADYLRAFGEAKAARIAA